MTLTNTFVELACKLSKVMIRSTTICYYKIKALALVSSADIIGKTPYGFWD